MRSLSRLGALALAALAAAPTAAAADPAPGTALFTNAVTYCAEQRAVLIDAFDIAYWKANSSVTFSFSFASVEANLNVSANLYLNDYGNTIFNKTFDLCSYFEGVLCPLPQVNFTGYGTYPISSSLIGGSIPSLAWTVPNLEAYARVELVNVDTGEVAACLQATLSNGWTTQWKGVKWGSAGLALAALLVGLAHAALRDSPSPAQYRWFDIVFLFQSAAAAGLLHLNYPLVFSNFAQNFAWSLGLLRSGAMQTSIDKMRDKTGGHLSGTAYSDVQYINRELSPYNVAALELVTLADRSLDDAAPASAELFMARRTLDAPQVAHLFKRATIASAVDQNATSDLTTGIPVYTNTDGIPQANALDTVFFILLAFIGIALALHAAVYLVALSVDRVGRQRKGTRWAASLRHYFAGYAAGNALRICLIFLYPVFIFAFYQWTIGRSDSGLSIFWSVFAICLVAGPLAAVLVLSLLRARRPSSTAPDINPLYTDARYIHSAGVLYRPYRPRFHWYWAALVLAVVARAGFIGFGQDNAWAQVIGLIVVEGLVFISLLVCRPHKDKKGDWLAPVLSFFRLVGVGLLIPFIESMNVKAIPRTIIGIVEIAVFGIPTVLLFFGLIWNAGYGYLWRRHKRRIEDGAEVERYVDDGSSDQPAMASINRAFVTTGTGSPATHTTSVDAEPEPDAARVSVLEPVDHEHIYDSPAPSVAGNRHSHSLGLDETASSHSLARPASQRTDPSSSPLSYRQSVGTPVSPISATVGADQRAASEAAYADVANGGGHARYDTEYAGRAY
ncbi:hypothetical protein Q5752_006862 [Cryptotrichosporon argae]